MERPHSAGLVNVKAVTFAVHAVNVKAVTLAVHLMASVWLTERGSGVVLCYDTEQRLTGSQKKRRPGPADRPWFPLFVFMK